MGNCFGTDVNAGTKAGQASDSKFTSLRQADAEQAAAAVTGSLGFSTWVVIHLRCQHLKDVDTLTKSDPMAFLFRQDGGQWVELGRTECVTNNLNPQFAKALKTIYNFEAVQRFRILIVDIDKGQVPETVRPQDATSLGEAEFVLSELLTSKDRTITKSLHSTASGATLKGSVTLSGEEVPNANALIEFQVVARGLANKDTFSKSDPFLQICRTIGDGGQSIPVVRTETRNNNLSPVWDVIKVTATQLCNGDLYQRIMLEVYDYNSNGNHALIGKVESSAQQMQQAAGTSASFQLTDPTSKKPKGELLISSFRSTPQPSFLDYLAGGTEINFVVAVDFTGSNGPPSDPNSLHYINPQGGTSLYENAIMGVGQVVEFYDSDKLFPAYGFGGAKRGEATHHCFPLNGDFQNPYNVGVPGVLQAYRQALQTYGLSGPTLFAPVIQTVAALAAQPTAHLRYSCLLILTDGEICDMEETIDAIVSASALPMSILIVGVGSSSFGSMVRLDADNQKLSSRGRTAERDIVQFVEFNKFRNNGAALAGELLRELPGQLTQYMRSRNIMPPPRPQPVRPAA